MATKILFVDRDGTLIEDVPYNVDPALMRWAAGAEEGVRRLHVAGFRLAYFRVYPGVVCVVVVGYPRTEIHDAHVEHHVFGYIERCDFELGSFRGYDFGHCAAATGKHCQYEEMRRRSHNGSHYFGLFQRNPSMGFGRTSKSIVLAILFP